MDEKKKLEKHFVLVHGACHGAWCWYKVVTILRSEGHRVTVIDLAASGANPKPIQEVYSISDYLEPLMEFMAAQPPQDKVVLVGHSMGGVALSVAMERFPQKIAVAVFATAVMPSPDLYFQTITQEFEKRMDSMMDTQFTLDPDMGRTFVVFGPKMLASKLYQLSPPEDLTLATLLVRPHPSFTDEKKLSEETSVTKENYGCVRRVYVVSDQDIILSQELQRWMIELNPPDEVKVINGSDHMIMLSKPQELSSCLHAIAHHYY